MEYINSYVVSVCFAIIVSVAVRMLSPSEKYGGIIGIVLGIFILYTLLSPAKNIIDNIFDTDNIFDFSNNYQNYGYYEKKTEQIFENASKEAEYNKITE